MTIVTVDSDVNDSLGYRWEAISRNMVVYDATTLYIFGIDNGTADFCYWKSTDAGQTWSGATTIFNKGAGATSGSIYYEKWNGASGRNIVHCAIFWDAGTPGVDRGPFYAQMTLGADTISTPVHVNVQGGGLNSRTSIAVSRDNSLILVAADGIFGGNATRKSTDDGATWSNTGAAMPTFIWGQFEFWPDFSSSDPQDMLTIWYDAFGTDDWFVRQLDVSAGTVSDTQISTEGSASYLNSFATTIDTSGDIYLAFWTSTTVSASKTLRTFKISGATVTAKTDVVVSTAYTADVGLCWSSAGVDCFYRRDPGGASASALEVFRRRSSDSMATWGIETSYNTDPKSEGNLIVPPITSTVIVAAWNDQTLHDLYVDAVFSPEYEQYRLMLSDGVDPDIAVLNITQGNIGNAGDVLIRTERGKESAVLGYPSRAGQANALINNYGLTYPLEEPTPGLAFRLNKRYDGTWYQLWHGNLDVPEHRMTPFRPVISVRALGTLTKLAGRKISTPLYQSVTTGAAIGYLLDAVGFPTDMRDLDTGDVTLPYWWLNDEDALTALWTLVNSEGITAEAYEAGDGSIVFRSRSARYSDARSTAIQNTFRNTNTDPRMNSFEYTSGYREIVNSATHERYRRTNDTAATVVWDDTPDFNYIVPPNGTLVVEAVASEPFFNAITPASGTDFSYGFDAPTVSLERTSGQRTKITFTSGANGTTLTGLQLRATTTINNATYVERSTIDASASIAAYGVRPWNGQMSKELSWADMRDNLDAIVSWKKDPRGRVKFAINAASGSVANQATAQREIGDRVRVIETGLDFDGECWIERIEHTVYAPAGPADGSAVGSEVTVYECSVISVAGGSAGTGVGETSPYTSIDNGAYVSDESSVEDDHGIPTRGASIF